MSISNAIGSERRSRVSGYKIRKGFFDNTTGNLPQLVAILGEANLANQGTLVTTATEVTSADQAGKLYGYGSPIHQMMRILRPTGSDGVGGIPTVVLAQASDSGATQTSIVWTVTGTATKNATHTIVVAGRTSLDFQSYSYSVVSGDTASAIATKIAAAANAVLNSPVAATVNAGVVTFKTKWAGATSAAIKVQLNANGDTAGLTYALTTTTSGSGSVSINGELQQFGENWYTTVINPYGEDQLAALEAFNGFPDDEAPTGRYQGRVFKPFMAFFGSVKATLSDLATITDAAGRVNQVTNILCPAPNSAGLPWEAAANMVTLFARIMQDTPQLDVNGKYYPDMPVPADGDIGDMAVYDNRDALVKKGCSTVMLINGAYQVQDLVTTYHPAGEIPLQYAYARNLNLDWNVKDGYTILEGNRVKDHVLVADNQVTTADRVIKPAEWKSVLFDYFDALAERALINDPEFSKASLQVQVSADNPNRFETRFRYRRTGIARIESTDVEAGY